MMARYKTFELAAARKDWQPSARPKDAIIPGSLLEQPVLVIEDEAMIAWTLETMLEDLGFENVMIASSGEKATSQAQSFGPRLVISDINLGAGLMDGVSATTEIWRCGSPIVIFVSGFVSLENKTRIESSISGATILRKPVSAEELRLAIVEAANRMSAH